MSRRIQPVATEVVEALEVRIYQNRLLAEERRLARKLGRRCGLYWLPGTSVRKIANLAFSSSLFAWHVKLDKGKSKDVLLAISEKKPQADEKNRRLLGERAEESHAQDGRESFQRTELLHPS